MHIRFFLDFNSNGWFKSCLNPPWLHLWEWMRFVKLASQTFSHDIKSIAVALTKYVSNFMITSEHLFISWKHFLWTKATTCNVCMWPRPQPGSGDICGDKEKQRLQSSKISAVALTKNRLVNEMFKILRTNNSITVLKSNHCYVKL